MLRNFWQQFLRRDQRQRIPVRNRRRRNLPNAAEARVVASAGLRHSVEALEERSLPAVIVVTSLADTVANDGQITLREAIQAANTDSVVDGTTGSGADTIQFAPALTASGPATITLNGTQLTISSDLTIEGPGADKLTIDGDNQSRIFKVDDGNNSQTSVKTVSISGLTLTRGKLNGDSEETAWGAAIFNRENLTVANSIVRDNSTLETYSSTPNTYSYGGAISSHATSATLTVIDSRITDNVTNGKGAGISAYDGRLNVIRSTISGNTAGRSGGGISNSFAIGVILDSEISNNTASISGGGVYNIWSLTVSNSTISGNTAGLDGGGVLQLQGTLTLNASTISGNASNRYGGGIAIDGDRLFISQSTITGNSSVQSGGGIHAMSTQAARVLSLRNAILVGNSAGDRPSDFETRGSQFSAESKHNVIGDPATAGGLTHGVNGNIVGNGSGEVLDVATVLDTTLADNGGPTKTHALVAGSPAINAGNNALIPADALDLDGDGDTTEALPFDQRGTGFARIVGETVDIGAVEFQDTGASVTDPVVDPNVYVVDTLTDVSDGDFSAGNFSLREAIERANATPEHQTITFAAALTSSGPATITLAGTQLTITSDLTIDGPGADKLTIDADQKSRVFEVDDRISTSHRGVSIVGLTLSNAKSSGVTWQGGGIFNREVLTILQCSITGNAAESDGGGVFNTGTLNVIDSTFSGNTAPSRGGGVFNDSNAVLNIIRSTFSDNRSSSSGGAVMSSGWLTVLQSTLSGNTASGDGGAIYNEANATITQSTISGNSSGGSGGGIFNYARLSLTQSTITGNLANRGAGVFNYNYAGNPNNNKRATFVNSVVAGNKTSGQHIANDVDGLNPLDATSSYNIIGSPLKAGSLTHGVNGNIVGNGSGGVLDVATVLDTTLADNGGPTKTHALVAGSPAINAGNNSLIPADALDLDGDGDTTEALPFDQRGTGFARIVAETVDIGAVEFQDTAATDDDGSELPDVPYLRIGDGAANPEHLVVMNGAVFFFANDGTHGRELWTSDGTLARTQLVKDIQTGEGDGTVSGSRTSVVVGNTLYFVADDGISGAELWKSDGTAAGTVRVTDIQTGAAGSSPQQLTNVNGTLFFTADDGVNGRELWKSDGTAAGTVLVKDLLASGSADPTELVNVGGTLFFTANDGTNGRELWKSDGTSTGTLLVKDIRSGSLDSSPQFLTNVNGTLFFSATDGTAGRELWKSDGTASGTLLVKDIRAGASDSSPQSLTSVNGQLWFSANDGTNGRELWKSDGSSTGTTLVKNINAGSANSNPADFTLVGSTIFFTANNGTNGRELWKTNGTDSGTVLVQDIFAGVDHANPQNLTNIHGRLWFTVIDGTHGSELWISEGTAASTQLVQDVADGSVEGAPSELTTLNANSEGLLFFTAHDGTSGRQLWTFDTASIPVAVVPASLSIAAASASQSEGNSGTTPFTFTVTRSGDSSSSASVNFAVTGSGTNAADTTDFGGSLPNGTISFAAGETSKTITVNVSGDTAIEANEEFTVTLSNPVGATLETSNATGTIQTDDRTFSIAIANAARTEGNSGSIQYSFTITRTGDTSVRSSVEVKLEGSGSNPATASDFVGGSIGGTSIWTFDVGQTTGTYIVNVSGDTTIEPDETFAVTLSNPSGATLGTASATATIVNDDGSALAIAASSASKAEGNSGSTPFTFTVTRSGSTGGSASANWAVAGSGSNAANASDFGGTLPSGTINFSAGETSKTITVNVSGDTTSEQAEGFTVTLSNATGATIGTSSAAGTILDDDTVVTGFVVDTLVDESDGNFEAGDLSLREAIERANATAGHQTITFASSLTAGVPGTITLSGTQLLISSDMTIVGPGADKLTIDGDQRSRIFQVDDSSTTKINVLISGLTLANGKVVDDRGGAILNRESLAVVDSIIQDNSANYGGSAIRSEQADLAVSQSTIRNNSGGRGAISSFQGTLTVTHCTINDNSANSYGGGIDIVLTTTVVEQSTIVGNSAQWKGGGILNDASNLTVVQSTIAGNFANEGGGGIYTFAGNNLTLHNSILIQNTTVGGQANDLMVYSGVLASAKNNVIGDPLTAGGLTHGINGNIVGTDNGSGGRAKLDAASVLSMTLADNGGPTQTLALVSGSPAIDAGNDALIPLDRFDLDVDGDKTEATPFDQRETGFARVTGSHVDIGAFESGSTDIPELTTDDLANVLLDESGQLWIRDLAVGGRADRLTVAFDESSQEFVIGDSQNALAASVGTIVNSREIRVARADVTGNGLRVELNGGADRLDLSGLPTGLLTVEVDGGDGNDTIIGHAGADLIVGGLGDDCVSAGAGNDTVSGGDGQDELRGESGDDVLYGQMNHDRLLGGDGDDSADGGGGDDTIAGDAGNDTLAGSTGNDSLSGGDGRDQVFGGDGRDSLEGNSGSDEITGGLGNDSLDGGAGDDYLDGQAGDDLVNGSHGSDTLHGGLDNDTLLGLSGDDLLEGHEGNDLQKGGEGNDTLLGGDGDDTLSGSVGDDWEEGGAGADTLAGGHGNDTLSGGADHDFAHGDEGTDELRGDAGDDSLDGGAGEDMLSGDSGDDVLVGGADNDTLTGGDDNDLLLGKAGDDELDGEAGRDTLTGGSGTGADAGDVLNSDADDELQEATAVATLSISADAASQSEGHSGETPFTFTVTRDGDAHATASVDYAISGSGANAANGTDFGGTLPNGTIHFAFGETTKTITVLVKGDVSFESDEQFTVTLSNPTGAELLAASAVGTILNDDALSSLSIVATSASKAEGSSGRNAFTFTVTRSGQTSGAATVDFAVTSDAADEADFGTTLVSVSGGTTQIADSGTTLVDYGSNGWRYQQVSVGSLAGFESGDEPAGFANGQAGFGNLAEAGLTTRTAWALNTDMLLRREVTLGADEFLKIGVSIDNDVQVWVNGVELSTGMQVSEGMAVRDRFVFVTPPGVAHEGTNLVAIRARDRGGADFIDARIVAKPESERGQLPAGTITFAAGETSKTLTFYVNSDSTVEADEEFTVTLSNASGANVVTSAASGLIQNDDSSLTIVAADSSKFEGQSGEVPLTFTVTRGGFTSGSTSVSYSVTGTGTNPVNAIDFLGSFPSGSVNFAAGETTKTITINARGDTTAEPDENFLVTLANTAGVTLLTSSATGTILTDDNSLSISATDASRTEGDSGDTAFTFTVTRTGDLSGTASVDYVVAGSGTNAASADDLGGAFPSGTVNFAPGEASQALTIAVRGDSVVEANETFRVTLSNAVGANLQTTSATGTILNDDAQLSLGNDGVSVVEGDSGSQTISFPIQRTGNTSGSATVDFAVAGWTSGTVTFAAGDTLQWITLDVLGDTDPEDDQPFTVTLSNPAGATLGTASVSGTVLDDDRLFVQVTVDATGRLSLIENGGGEADDLTVTFDSLANEFVISSPVSDSLSVDRLTLVNEVRIAASQVTHGLFADLKDGDDRLNLAGIDLRTTVLGGAGHDSIIGSQGADSVDGGTGNDFVNGGNGRDVIFGGEGDDVLLGGSQEDTLNGGDGHDQLDGQGGSGDFVNGDAGNDTLRGGTGLDAIRGGDGDDTFVERLGGAASRKIVLTDASVSGLSSPNDAESLHSIERALIAAGSGKDRIDASAFSGSVTLLGGEGNDTLIGGLGDDNLQGQIGNDVLDGRAGHDKLLGGNGHDKMQGGLGDDTLEGGLSNDTLIGGDGDDSLVAGDGFDWLLGENGADTLNGDAGDDRLAGGGNGIAATVDDLVIGDPSEIDEALAFDFSTVLPG